MRPPLLLSRPTSIPLFPPPAHRRDCPWSSSSVNSRTRIFLDSCSFSSSSSSSCRRTISPLYSIHGVVDAVEAVPREEGAEELKFIEVGYISSVRGIKGELKVIPSTDFPELRFSEPGRRWLRARVLGKETIQEVELTEGRAHVGQNCWIISFSGFDTVDKAKQIVGSTILVRENDRPKLDEGEFYTADLVGMTVILKGTGKPVGTVTRVVNYGANDLLQVLLNSTDKRLGGPSSLKPEMRASDQLVWVPFVEEIVPDVDMKRKVMEITPPEGLLELNLHSDMRSKKERRQLEWKQRKKFQQQVIASKKKLCEIGQKHVLNGFLFGGKDQKNLLSHGIVDIDLRLFQHAVKSIGLPFERCSSAQFIKAYSNRLKGKLFSLTDEGLTTAASKERKDMHPEIVEKGWDLLCGCKVATILIVGAENNQGIVSDPDTSSPGKPASMVLKLKELLDNKKSGKMEKPLGSLPLIIVCPPHEVHSYQELLLEQDYFNYETEKVLFFEEEKLPAVDMSLTDQGTNKILMKSPWEVLKLPIGSGGVFSLLSSNQLLDDLNEMGIEYVQICSLDKRCSFWDPLFAGLIVYREADMCIKIFEASDRDDNFDIIFSIRYLSKIVKQTDKLQFFAIAAQNDHVELVDEDWVSMHPSMPNSYHLQCSIYSFLNTFPTENMCFLHSGD